jgi:hypothetical protein
LPEIPLEVRAKGQAVRGLKESPVVPKQVNRGS